MVKSSQQPVPSLDTKVVIPRVRWTGARGDYIVRGQPKDILKFQINIVKLKKYRIIIKNLYFFCIL